MPTIIYVSVNHGRDKIESNLQSQMYVEPTPWLEESRFQRDKQISEENRFVKSIFSRISRWETDDARGRDGWNGPRKRIFLRMPKEKTKEAWAAAASRSTTEPGDKMTPRSKLDDPRYLGSGKRIEVHLYSNDDAR